MKNKIILITTIIICLLGTALFPNIGAISIKIQSDEINDSTNFGKIEGKVMYAPLWTFSFPLTLATVKIGFQIDITKADGHYCIDGLKLNKEYILIYSHPLYKTKMFPITLTEDDPELELDLYFFDEDQKEFKSKNKEIKSSAEQQKCDLGTVSGSVIIHCFPPPEYIQGAKLVLEGDHNSRTTFSGLLGNFRFNFVETGKQYTLTATHPKFKSVTKTFTLSKLEPDLRIGIAMIGKDSTKSKILNSMDKSCGGTIYGYTGDHFDTWGSTPVPLTLIDAEVKKTISGFPMGSYKISGLPFNQEITITASKPGYKSDTIKHTFTELHPTYYYCFDLKKNDDVSVKEKIANPILELFSSILVCPDAGSNLLSTSAFVS